MLSVTRGYFRGLWFLLAVLALAACAPADLVIKPVYQPAGESKGIAGDLAFVMTVDGPARPSSDSIDSVYGDVKDTGGKIRGNIISKLSPSAFISTALQQELVKAGYSVKVATALPKDASQGVVVTNAVITLDETTSLVKIEGACKIRLALELWKQGVMVRKLGYEKNVTDYAVRDREKLHNQLLQRTLAAVMKDAQTDIVTYLGNPPVAK